MKNVNTQTIRATAARKKRYAQSETAVRVPNRSLQDLEAQTTTLTLPKKGRTAALKQAEQVSISRSTPINTRDFGFSVNRGKAGAKTYLSLTSWISFCSDVLAASGGRQGLNRSTFATNILLRKTLTELTYQIECAGRCNVWKSKKVNNGQEFPFDNTQLFRCLSQLYLLCALATLDGGVAYSKVWPDVTCTPRHNDVYFWFFNRDLNCGIALYDGYKEMGYKPTYRLLLAMTIALCRLYFIGVQDCLDAALRFYRKNCVKAWHKFPFG